MSALRPWIKKINPSKPRKTKSRIRIGALATRQMTNKRGIAQIATVNAVTHTRRQWNKENSCSASARLAPPKGGERPAALRPRNGVSPVDSARGMRRAAGCLLVAGTRAGLVALRQTFV
jgi:hypothetical protein